LTAPTWRKTETRVGINSQGPRKGERKVTPKNRGKDKLGPLHQAEEKKKGMLIEGLRKSSLVREIKSPSKKTRGKGKDMRDGKVTLRERGRGNGHRAEAEPDSQGTKIRARQASW